MQKGNPIDKALWSVALPGFGQFLNGSYFKGIVLIALEFLINSKAHLNMAIVESFHGNIGKAINSTDYQWLMFYPCVYMFGIWDAYRDGGGRGDFYTALPFILAAYFGTVGVIYSRRILGPIWLPIIGLFLGGGVGYVIKKYRVER